MAEYLEIGHGLVAGLVVVAAGRDCHVLRDASGELPLEPEVVAELGPVYPQWVAIDFEDDGRFAVRYRQVCQPDAATVRLQARYPVFRQRWSIHGAIRQFFQAAGFIEADTPVRVTCPGMEPYLDTFATGAGYLRTSPELHMKRLLAGGFDRAFQIGPCFRAGDLGRLHREEFLMLEWYRLFADLDEISADLHGLLTALAPFSIDPDYFCREPAVTTCAALFRDRLGVELGPPEDRETLRAATSIHGLNWDADDDWDTLFFRLFLNFIEPDLGHDRPVLVTNYPASQRALAKLAPDLDGRLPYCYRMELFVRGVELANAYYELTDVAEQKQRFEDFRAERRSLGKPVYESDGAFLDALASGLPPAAGIALGVDRLVAVLLGATDLDAVLPFPPGG